LQGKWSIEAASILRCFAALINHLSVEDLSGLLRPLMIPIFRIIEDSNTKDPQMRKYRFRGFIVANLQLTHLLHYYSHFGSRTTKPGQGSSGVLERKSGNKYVLSCLWSTANDCDREATSTKEINRVEGKSLIHFQCFHFVNRSQVDSD
jgi:hypothetical protein